MIKVGGYQLAWVAGVRGGEIQTEAHASLARMEAQSASWMAGSLGRDLAWKAIRGGLAVTHTHGEGAEVSDTAGLVKAVLALPLIPDGSAIGCLLIYSGDSDAFDEKETALLQQAANDVAQGIMLFRARAARAAAEAALERTQSELTRVARVTTMGELTASIAHEINQPLAAVVTNANALLRWLDREPPNLDEVREAARRIIRDGKRGSEVITRIRALLKKEDAVRSSLSINEAVGDILALTRSEMDGIALEVNLDPDIPTVPADRVLIQQVLLNLILNAIDAMGSVSDRPPKLHLSTRRNADGMVEIAVCDAGIGLPPDRIEKVFDTFFTTKANGLGMGLAICRSIIEQHGGRLWAEANEDYGATFRFALPVEEGR
jgi:signal transduction histidine kinase